VGWLLDVWSAWWCCVTVIVLYIYFNVGCIDFILVCLCLFMCVFSFDLLGLRIGCVLLFMFVLWCSLVLFIMFDDFSCLAALCVVVTIPLVWCFGLRLLVLCFACFVVLVFRGLPWLGFVCFLWLSLVRYAWVALCVVVWIWFAWFFGGLLWCVFEFVCLLNLVVLL